MTKRVAYRCIKDVINKRPIPISPYTDSDYYPLIQYIEFYAFIQGHAYIGQKANRQETKQEGILFTNHQGEEHFISLPFLAEHFEEVAQ